MPRHREYDREQVLNKAMQIFWFQGYNNTSLQELEKAMGINRFGIYATFNDKHSLFLDALAYYRHTVVNTLLAPLEGTSGLEGITSFFSQFIELSQAPSGNWGCLICNSATELGLHDKAVTDQIEQHKERVKGALHNALRNAQQHGELASEADLDTLSTYLLGALFGLMIYTKTQATPHELTAYIHTLLSVLR